MTDKHNLILVALATEHSRKKPEATAAQLMQLFTISHDDACRARKMTGSRHASASAETVEAALAWAVANQGGGTRIQQKYGMGEKEACRIALAAKNINADKIASRQERLDKAFKYAKENPRIGSKAIGKMFDASEHAIARLRKIHSVQVRIDAEAARPVKLLRRRFVGLVDGVWVDPSTVRNPGKIERFTEVMK